MCLIFVYSSIYIFVYSSMFCVCSFAMLVRHVERLTLCWGPVCTLYCFRLNRPREVDNVQKTGKSKAGTTTYFATKYLSSPENLAKVARDRAQDLNFGASMETKKFFTVSPASCRMFARLHASCICWHSTLEMSWLMILYSYLSDLSSPYSNVASLRWELIALIPIALIPII